MFCCPILAELCGAVWIAFGVSLVLSVSRFRSDRYVVELTANGTQERPMELGEALTSTKFHIYNDFWFWFTWAAAFVGVLALSVLFNCLSNSAHECQMSFFRERNTRRNKAYKKLLNV